PQVMPFNLVMYKQIEKVLKRKVNNIRCSEGRLYSNKLKVAGSVDLIADYEGKPAVIDFKTSAKNKKKEWIEAYFLQVSMYSFMFWEMTGIFINDIVIIIAVEQELEPQI